MSLTLTVRNLDRLDNGMPAEFVLNRRGAMIGRAATCEWSLPDPRAYISSRHAELSFREGFYYYDDISTNGTFLNGGGERMQKGQPRRIENGDLFLIGQYEVVASLSGEAVVAVERHEQHAAEEAQRQAGWSWDQSGGQAAAPPPSQPNGGWGGGPPAVDGNGWGGGGQPGGHYQGEPNQDWGPAPASGGNENWGAPAGNANSGWGAPPANGANSGWNAPPAEPGWAPPANVSLSAPTPYAQRGGGGGAPMPMPGGPPVGNDAWVPNATGPIERAPSPWDPAQTPVAQASTWSSVADDRPAAATPNDLWGSMESSNVVDWARADFGQKIKENDDPLGLNRPAPGASLPEQAPPVPGQGAPADGGWGGGPQGPTPGPAGQGDWGPGPAQPDRSSEGGAWAGAAPSAPPQPPPVAAPAPAAMSEAQMATIVAGFAAAAGVRPDQLRQLSPATLERAGQVLRRLVSGLVVMVEARARAKSQMGAEQTGLEFDGNNPIKFARAPEQALAQLLNPPERGFMPAEKAIEDAFFDLQSHQMATLKAMQGALRATLDRFSPDAIKKRAESGGFLSRLLPGGREATLWHTYEKEFSGVARGSDEAFMDVFAKEFRDAYNEQSRNRRR
ncbi:type VI secretion system-associated FHA domain protein TagH [Sphingomonas sp.]|uniref:type VI secretion system-associated FHA domain protein TagH n=1 Tax=Sphingomonas sp. TaxID=28214 RepID=UPI003CC60E16